jgi:hypothetical protein
MRARTILKTPCTMSCELGAPLTETAMTPTAVPLPRTFEGPAALGRAMFDSLRGYWTAAAGYQRFLYLGGALLVVSGLFHVAVFLVAGGSLEGSISWRKPIAFGLSGGLAMISVGWVMTFLPRQPVAGWLLAGLVGLLLPEVAWVDLQQWRGVRSHFNESTPFDAALFSAAGAMIALVALAIVALTLWTFISLRAPSSFAWAIRVGLVLLVAGQLFGYLIVANGSGQPFSEAGREPNIFGAAGVMKQPHALALHGIQVLGALAWLLAFALWSERRRTGVVVAAAAGYSGLVAVSAYQVFNGLAPFDLGLPAALALGTSALLLVAAWIAAFVGLRQTLVPEPARKATIRA